MRIHLTFLAILCAAVFAAGSRTGARADDCVNTAVNNPAFSSTYVSGARPCPPPLVKARNPAASASLDAPVAEKPANPPKTKTASAKPVTDPDHATVTHTPSGTLLKFGETTVCVSGSVSVDVVGGSGHPRPMRNNSAEPACN